jgi:hypothetical protein
MRNQIRMAERAGVRASTINGESRDDCEDHRTSLVGEGSPGIPNASPDMVSRLPSSPTILSLGDSTDSRSEMKSVSATAGRASWTSGPTTGAG